MVRTAFPGDVEELAGRLRPEDARAAGAFTGMTPQEALAFTLMLSPRAWTVEVGGRPVAMFGVALPTALADVGQPWLVGTPEMSRYGRLLLRLARSYLIAMRRVAPRLAGLMDARDGKAVRWLRRVGFRVGEPVRIDDNLFRPIEWRGGA